MKNAHIRIEPVSGTQRRELGFPSMLRDRELRPATMPDYSLLYSTGERVYYNPDAAPCPRFAGKYTHHRLASRTEAL